jgi:hypothetical protein
MERVADDRMHFMRQQPRQALACLFERAGERVPDRRVDRAGDEGLQPDLLV